jgi:Asp-tRNA(Asn)/Glu-tRNA(Gln) amidotransferase A subunit family amidase
MNQALGWWSLTELRAAEERGEVSAVEAARVCLETIARENEELRAFVSVAGSEALYAATEYDALHAAALRATKSSATESSATSSATTSSAAALNATPSGAEGGDSGKVTGTVAGPLGGVPIAIKDLIDVRGMKTTAASRVLEDAAPAEADAECVRRLRAAGAILVGKTNLHEFAYGASGAISAYGAARNPLDRAKVCGGSSSGSAAAVAAGMCFGALGTDTAGSIRLPAACCGVVGFKPTWGAVPVAGVIPLAWSYDHVGPLARTVEDAAIIYAVLVGEAWPSSEQGEVQSWAQTFGLRCGVVRRHFCEDLAPEVEAGFARALEAVRRLGWSMCDVEIERNESRKASNAESWAFHEKWVEERGHLYDPRTLPRIINGKKVRVEEYVEARRALEWLRERNRAGVEGVDVVLTPTCPILPPSLKEIVGPEARELELKMLRNTRAFNVLGWPTVSVPCAPMVGVQVSAGWGKDWLALAAAREIEQALLLTI